MLPLLREPLPLLRELALRDLVLPPERAELERDEPERDELEREPLERDELEREPPERDELERDELRERPLEELLRDRLLVERPLELERLLDRELLEERRRRLVVALSALGISVRATSLTSRPSSASRNLAMRSSSRLIDLASWAVSRSPTASARVWMRE